MERLSGFCWEGVPQAGESFLMGPPPPCTFYTHTHTHTLLEGRGGGAEKANGSLPTEPSATFGFTSLLLQIQCQRRRVPPPACLVESLQVKETRLAIGSSGFQYPRSVHKGNGLAQRCSNSLTSSFQKVQRKEQRLSHQSSPPAAPPRGRAATTTHRYSQ